MGVAVAEARHQQAALGVDYLFLSGRSGVCSGLPHSAEVFDGAVGGYAQPGVVQDSGLGHLLPLLAQDAFRHYSDELAYVLDNHKYCSFARNCIDFSMSGCI